MANPLELLGKNKNWIKLKGIQDWKNTNDNTIWKIM
ncbi:Pretoxin HINT domain protein [endosymbiont GvMRE of Glomus versiforme]|nr:Pretoxin HINT domain protein [endosymbiont GvMRE of Glomus versiforme]